MLNCTQPQHHSYKREGHENEEMGRFMFGVSSQDDPEETEGDNTVSSGPPPGKAVLSPVTVTDNPDLLVVRLRVRTLEKRRNSIVGTSQWGRKKRRWKWRFYLKFYILLLFISYYFHLFLTEQSIVIDNIFQFKCQSQRFPKSKISSQH